MARYAQLDDDGVRALAGLFQLPPVTGWIPIAGGFENSSFLVSTAVGRYVLTVCTHRDAGAVARWMAVVEHVVQHGFPTPAPERTRDGRLVAEHDLGPAIVKRHIEGEVPEHLGVARCRAAGAALAHLHSLPAPSFLPRISLYGLHPLDEISHLKHHFVSWCQEHRVEMERRVSPRAVARLPTGLIHADLFPDNLVFAGDELVAVLDLEECCLQPFVLDLGMALAGCCREHPSRPGLLAWSRVRALLEGYQGVRRLTREELRMLQWATVHGAAVTALWRFRQYHVREPDRSLAHRHREMVQLANRVRSMEPEAFLVWLDR